MGESGAEQAVYLTTSFWYWIIGAAFVAVHSFGRYNTPRTEEVDTSVSSTSVSRFIVFYLGYLLSLLTLFVFLVFFMQSAPKLAEDITPLLGGTSLPEGFPEPIAAALILSTMLPAFPGLKRFDRWLLQRFWDLGHIPSKLRRQVEKLRRAILVPAPDTRRVVVERAQQYGISLPYDSVERMSPIKQAWFRPCCLMVEIENWQKGSDDRYRRFHAANADEIDALAEEFRGRSGKLSSLLARVENVDAEPGDGDAPYEIVLRDEQMALNTVWKRLCGIVVRGVYACELTETSRRNAFESLGFDQKVELRETLSIPQILWLFAVICVALLGVAVIELWATEDTFSWWAGWTAMLIAANYAAAAFVAHIPASVFRFANRDDRYFAPIRAYATAGVAALFVGLVVLVTLRYGRQHLWEGLPPELAIEAVRTAFGWSFPYLLNSLVIGAGLAFITDFSARHWEGVGHRNRWLREALCVSGLMMASSAVVYFWVVGAGVFEPIAPNRDPKYIANDHLWMFLLEGAVIGVVLGGIVPSSLRRNYERNPLQRLLWLLDRTQPELRDEARQLPPGALKEALATIAARVAAADGQTDRVERKVFRDVMTELVDLGAVDFTVDEALDLFDRLGREIEDRLSRDDQEVLTEEVPTVHALRAHQVLSEIGVRLGIAIACADDYFFEEERVVVQRVIADLSLRETRFELFGA